MPEIGIGAPEAKAQTGEPAAMHCEFMEAFESFREANDERLSQIERRMSADVVSEEKVERIGRVLEEQERSMERLQLRGLRPALGGSGEAAAALQNEHGRAFHAYVRGGDERGIRRIE